MDMRGFRVFYVGVFFLLLQGCDGGRSDSSPNVLGENDGAVLQAEAGSDLSATEGDIVELDGGFSVNQVLIRSYFWSQTSGPTASLTNPDSPQVSFSAPDVSEFSLLTFRLTVTDQHGGSDSDDVSVAVYPVPTAAFGIDSRPPNSTCLATQSPPKKSVPTGISLEQVFTSLSFNFPLLMLQAPGNNSRWYVVERRGSIKTFKSNDTHSTVFANLAGRLTAPAHRLSEQGLLGMAFHPKYAKNRYVFFFYIGADGSSIVSRFTANRSGLRLDLSSEKIILTLARPTIGHSGGNIAFGSDGYLYIGVGDGGTFEGDVANHGQSTTDLFGAMLRIDVNSGDPYSIPAGNPFPASNVCGVEACPEIWAWGLRNPWRWSFDKNTGKLWAGDVGKEKWEEIDIVGVGKNYGWRCYEGLHENNTTACLSADKYTAPVAEYPHTQGNLSVTGGYVYRGASVPGLQGSYLYADFGSGQIWGLPAQLNAPPKLLLGSGLSIASFAQDNQGELYVIDYFGGRVYKIISEGRGNTEVFPRKLSETGCFDSADITQPVKGLIPYTVNTRLWSDGLGKNRWMALPDGETITIDSDGDNWVFPIGSVLIKEFRLGEKRIETRLLMRHRDGAWAGYSYEWNEEQTDAILLDGGKNKPVNGQVWNFPSRAQCMRCHTKAADFVLGPETVGLNGLFTYPGSGETANQISTLDHIGLFTSPLPPGSPGTMNTVVNYSDPSQTSEARARSYLHANCSNCHQPDATGLADFRYRVSFKEMGVCDALPKRNNLGISDARLFAPASPERSLLLQRMKTSGVGRMPLIGSRVVDLEGVGIVTDWINSVTVCPEL
jgi:uncharacterized repeat protein (TIGR03806 family)